MIRTDKELSSDLIMKAASQISQKEISEFIQNLLKPIEEFFDKENNLPKMFLVADAIKVIMEENYKPTILRAFRSINKIDKELN